MLNRFPHLTGWGWESDADRRAAHAALDVLGLASFATRDVLSLSGGERQRVALAATLCQDAPLLLLDEPLSHLDLHHQIDALMCSLRWTRRSQRLAHDHFLVSRSESRAPFRDARAAARRRRPRACRPGARRAQRRARERCVRLSAHLDPPGRSRGARARDARARNVIPTGQTMSTHSRLARNRSTAR